MEAASVAALFCIGPIRFLQFKALRRQPQFFEVGDDAERQRWIAKLYRRDIDGDADVDSAKS